MEGRETSSDGDGYEAKDLNCDHFETEGEANSP